MRNRRLRGLALTLGLLAFHAAAVRAGEGESTIHPWPPVAESPSLEQPAEPAAPAEDPAPAATLARPVPIRSEPEPAESGVQPTGLFNRRSGDPGAFGSAPVYTSAQPLPTGPALPPGAVVAAPGATPTTSPTPDVPYTWQQPAMPRPLPSGNSSSGPLVPVPDNSIPMPQTMPNAPGLGGVPPGNPICDGSMSNGCGVVCPDNCGTPCPCPCPTECCPPDCCAPDACAPVCGDGCGWGGWHNRCCFGNRWFGSAEYLLWFINGQPLPPLVTTGPITAPIPGALGQPGTTVLYGNQAVSDNPYSGGRFRLGYWLGDGHGLGIEGGFFFLGPGGTNFSTASSGTPFLGRPFYNALTGMPDVEAVAAPTGLAGSVGVTTNTFLYGVEANLRRNSLCGCNWYLDGLVGWRQLGLNESLNVAENLTVFSSANPALPAGSTFAVADHFRTHNLFDGVQVGGVFFWRLGGRWSAEVRSTVAFGVTQQVVDVFGSTTATAPGAVPMLSTGGLLAQSSNIGRHVHNNFGVIPEVGLNIGYQFTNHIRGFVGYNFFYWSSVARPGNQIDQVVNPNLIPPAVAGGPARPGFNFNGSGFWAQGINFGLDIRW